MWLIKNLLLYTLLLPIAVYAQITEDSAFKQKDSLQHIVTGLNKVDTINYQKPRLGWKNYYNLGRDNFKRQALFPIYLKGNDWLKLGAYTLISGSIAFANKPIQTYATNLKANNPGLSTISKYVTRFGDPYIKYILTAGLATGLLSKDRKLETTTLLASQAYFISNILGGAIKVLTGLQGPFYTDPFTNKIEPVFRGPFYIFKKTSDGQQLSINNYGSFPSGHTYSAFAVATVYAMQYRNKPIIPVVAYGIASLVGLSRLTENRHWAMDILPGALLGYYSGKQVVKNFRRFYKENKLHKTKMFNVAFNMQYINQQLMPGLIVRW